MLCFCCVCTLTATQECYAAAFCSADRRVAASELRATASRSKSWMTFRVGFFLGIALCEAIAVFAAQTRPLDAVESFVIFRMSAMVVLIAAAWGAAIFVWKKTRVCVVVWYGDVIW